MNKALLFGALTVFSVMSVLVFVGISSYISNYNYGNMAENQIKARYKNMENILGQYSLKIKEIAKVPEMKTEDLEKVMKTAMEGRYGDDGSTAVFQWIQEAYPGQVTDAMYTQIQQAMEAGRNKFENEQTTFIEQVNIYEINLGYLWKGFWLSVAGYPKINLDDYKIISSSHAKEAFESGIDKPVDIR